jgi:hypothetical protein
MEYKGRIVMEFIIGNKPNEVHASRWVPFNTKTGCETCCATVYQVLKIDREGKYIDKPLELVAEFPDINNEHAEAMAHDYCDFLNDKYYDKEINKEWPIINREERIKYHINQLNKLVNSERLRWNEHGTGVK